MMAFRPWLLSLPLLLTMWPALAIPSGSSSLAERADAYAEGMPGADVLLMEIDESIALARRGAFGSISDADLERLDGAHMTVVRLLHGYENARHLAPEQRIELYNAQELITAILRGDLDQRRVCRRVAGTGTRMVRTECLTANERAERAEAVQRDTRRIQFHR